MELDPLITVVSIIALVCCGVEGYVDSKISSYACILICTVAAYLNFQGSNWLGGIVWTACVILNLLTFHTKHKLERLKQEIRRKEENDDHQQEN